MHIKRNFLRTIASWAALLLFVGLFDPTKLPVVVLIAPFVLLFVALYNTWILVTGMVLAFLGRVEAEQVGFRSKLGVVVCGSLVLLLVLQSLGQLTPRDVLTLFAIVALGYFFIKRNKVDNSKQ